MSSSGTEPKAVGEGESLLGSVKRLEGLLENVHAYVNDVVVSFGGQMVKCVLLNASINRLL